MKKTDKKNALDYLTIRSWYDDIQTKGLIFKEIPEENRFRKKGVIYEI